MRESLWCRGRPPRSVRAGKQVIGRPKRSMSFFLSRLEAKSEIDFLFRLRAPRRPRVAPPQDGGAHTRLPGSPGRASWRPALRAPGKTSRERLMQNVCYRRKRDKDRAQRSACGRATPRRLSTGGHAVLGVALLSQGRRAGQASVRRDLHALPRLYGRGGPVDRRPASQSDGRSYGCTPPRHPHGGQPSGRRGRAWFSPIETADGVLLGLSTGARAGRDGRRQTPTGGAAATPQRSCHYQARLAPHTAPSRGG